MKEWFIETTLNDLKDGLTKSRIRIYLIKYLKRSDNTMSTNRQARYWLEKKANRGFRGYPIATIADYGPNNKVATKIVISILVNEDDITAMEKWFSDSDNPDVRYNPSINRQILEFIESHQVKSVAIADRIIGCPHEEGVDYPEGERCPQCPFWQNIDRWTGNVIN